VPPARRVLCLYYRYCPLYSLTPLLPQSRLASSARHPRLRVHSLLQYLPSQVPAPQPRRIVALETGMYLIGCTYNFCFPHHELSKPSHVGSPCTPAMAAGLTDHIWSFCELLSYRIALLPWVSPAKRGRPKKLVASILRKGPRPLVRLRKGVLCSSTV
jgi:hypothetical protein